MTPTQQLKVIIVAIYTTIVATITWNACNYWHKPKSVVATAHTQQDLGGGNVLAARTMPQPDAKPATVVPAGDTPIATTHVVIRSGKPVVSQNSADIGHKAASVSPDLLKTCQQVMSCPATTIDETLVKDKTGQLDLIVKGQDGAVIDQASLTPILPPMVAPEHRNALGVTYWTDKRWTGAYEHDFGPIRLGVQAGQGADGKPEAGVSALWRF